MSKRKYVYRIHETSSERQRYIILWEFLIIKTAHIEYFTKIIIIPLSKHTTVIVEF